MLAEYGLLSSMAGRRSYRCTRPGATFVPTVELTWSRDSPLSEERVRSILTGIRDNVDMPPAVAFRERGDGRTVVLLDGLHRVRVSIAVGLTHVPCRLVDRSVAEFAYGVPPVVQKLVR